MEPIDSWPLLLSRLACLRPADDEPEDESRLPGLIDESN
ncbi:hypothetical protein FHR32_005144 [Streptosporangium album]|uniref:Uncharacterized protein n=1 Tax=Streptosporangium album TaxID=47479 RepID=A0A7W7WAT0_9ACTN|nr:hypothetical protein [Streptosporangium album]